MKKRSTARLLDLVEPDAHKRPLFISRRIYKNFSLFCFSAWYDENNHPNGRSNRLCHR